MKKRWLYILLLYILGPRSYVKSSMSSCRGTKINVIVGDRLDACADLKPYWSSAAASPTPDPSWRPFAVTPNPHAKPDLNHRLEPEPNRVVNRIPHVSNVSLFSPDHASMFVCFRAIKTRSMTLSPQMKKHWGWN